MPWGGGTDGRRRYKRRVFRRNVTRSIKSRSDCGHRIGCSRRFGVDDLLGKQGFNFFQGEIRAFPKASTKNHERNTVRIFENLMEDLLNNKEFVKSAFGGGTHARQLIEDGKISSQVPFRLRKDFELFDMSQNVVIDGRDIFLNVTSKLAMKLIEKP